MKRTLVLTTLILLTAGFIATQITQPPLQTHTLIEGTPCHWNLYCGEDLLSTAALAGRGGILIGMLLATLLALHVTLHKLTIRSKRCGS